MFAKGLVRISFWLDSIDLFLLNFEFRRHNWSSATYMGITEKCYTSPSLLGQVLIPHPSRRNENIAHSEHTFVTEVESAEVPY